MHLKCATTYRPSSLGKGFPRRIDLPPRILQNGLLSGVPATWLEIYAFNNALYSRTSDVRVPGSGALWGVPRWHCLPQRPHSHHPHHHHHHNRLWGPWTLLCANMVVNMMSFVGLIIHFGRTLRNSTKFIKDDSNVGKTTTNMGFRVL